MGNTYRGDMFVEADSPEQAVEMVRDDIARGGGELIDHRTYAILYDPIEAGEHVIGRGMDFKYRYRVSVVTRQV